MVSEPVVARTELDRQSYVCLGESTYYSGLYVDEDGRLRKVDPCQDAESCAVANVWRDAQNALTGALDKTTLADVV